MQVDMPELQELEKLESIIARSTDDKEILAAMDKRKLLFHKIRKEVTQE